MYKRQEICTEKIIKQQTERVGISRLFHFVKIFGRFTVLFILVIMIRNGRQADRWRKRMNTYTLLLVDDEEEVIQIILKKIPWEKIGFSVIGHADLSLIHI